VRKRWHSTDQATSDLGDLNGDTQTFTALLAVPGTAHKVKVVYGMGQGKAWIGQHSPVGNTLLALFGEGGAAMGPYTRFP